MVNLETKISFMFSKFRDLIIKAALDLIKKRHQNSCPLGNSMQLSAKLIEKEPSKLESAKLKTILNEKQNYIKKPVSQNINLYTQANMKTEVQVSCCCGQKFTLTNKDKEFQNELNKAQNTVQQTSYEVKQSQPVSKDYSINKEEKKYK